MLIVSLALTAPLILVYVLVGGVRRDRTSRAFSRNPTFGVTMVMA